MYWSLQQPVEESDSSPSTARTPDASPGSSINGSPSPLIAGSPVASPALTINGSSSPVAVASPDESPAPSVNGEDDSSLGGEISNLTMDDAASDCTVSSSQVENEDAQPHIEQ